MGFSRRAKIRFLNEEESRPALTFGDTGIDLLLDLLVWVALWTTIISALLFGAGGVRVTVALHLVVIVLHLTTTYTKAFAEDTAVVTIAGLKEPMQED